MGDFSALNTAYSALATHRRRIDVTSQNIANADTPGYTRLRPELTSQIGTGTAGLFSGPALSAGVGISGTSRLREEVLDQQARNATGRAGSLTEQSRALAGIEDRLDGLGGGSLSAQMQALWNAFGDVANEPGSSTARQVVLQRTEQVVATVNQLGHELVAQRTAEVGTLQARLEEVNDLARAVASQQPTIGAAHAAGSPAHDLLDEQDRMLDRLSELAGVEVVRRTDGTVNLYLDGHDLVSDGIVKPLSHTMAGPPDAHGFLRAEVVGGPPTRTLEVRHGQIAGLLSVVNHTLPEHLTALDGIAANLAATVNPVHAAGRGLDGVTGRNLLATATPPAFTARSLLVDPSVAGQPSHVAVAGAAEGALGSDAARQLAGLADSDANPALLVDRLVGGVGAQLASTRVRSEAANSNVARALAARDAVSGVSLDEELTNLIETQRAYESAARLLTTVDEMLDILINRTGLVGR